MWTIISTVVSDGKEGPLRDAERDLLAIAKFLVEMQIWIVVHRSLVGESLMLKQ